MYKMIGRQNSAESATCDRFPYKYTRGTGVRSLLILAYGACTKSLAVVRLKKCDLQRNLEQRELLALLSEVTDNTSLWHLYEVIGSRSLGREFDEQ